MTDCERRALEEALRAAEAVATLAPVMLAAASTIRSALAVADSDEGPQWVPLKIAAHAWNCSEDAARKRATRGRGEGLAKKGSDGRWRVRRDYLAAN